LVSVVGLKCKEVKHSMEEYTFKELKHFYTMANILNNLNTLK